MDRLDVGAAEFIEPSHFTCLVTIVWQPLAMTAIAAAGAAHPGEWALRCLEPGHLPEASEAGGQVLPSPFLGQARVHRSDRCGGSPQAVSHDGLCRHHFFCVDNV